MLTEAQIEHLVQRFLNYKLPYDFTPDGGITFESIANPETVFEYVRRPTGTNLLNYQQAKDMVLEMLNYLPFNDAYEAGRKYERENYVDGLRADLDYAVEVAWKHGAHEFVRLNYPEQYTRLCVTEKGPSIGFNPEVEVEFVTKSSDKGTRDEFAKAALTGILSRSYGHCPFKYFAEEAYAIADAMMEARDAG